jgi:hypothetical protein
MMLWVQLRVVYKIISGCITKYLIIDIYYNNFINLFDEMWKHEDTCSL